MSLSQKRKSFGKKRWLLQPHPAAAAAALAAIKKAEERNCRAREKRAQEEREERDKKMEKVARNKKLNHQESERLDRENRLRRAAQQVNSRMRAHDGVIRASANKKPSSVHILPPSLASNTHHNLPAPYGSEAANNSLSLSQDHHDLALTNVTRVNSGGFHDLFSTSITKDVPAFRSQEASYSQAVSNFWECCVIYICSILHVSQSLVTIIFYHKILLMDTI